MIIIFSLEQLGFNEFYEKEAKTYILIGYTVARVFAEHKHMYKLYTEFGEMIGEISGKLRHEAID